MKKLDIYAPAIIGKSLAGFNLGDDLSDFLSLIDTTIDGKHVTWTIDLAHDNQGILLYQLPSNEGYYVYFKTGNIELLFNENQKLCHIIAGEGYQGNIFENVKIGNDITAINHNLILDDAEDVHYLIYKNGEVINGIYFVADGLEISEYPNQTITEIKVFDYQNYL